MKNFMIILLTISCAVILFLGNQQWKEKVQVEKQSYFCTNEDSGR